MTPIAELVGHVTDMTNFKTLDDYRDFALSYLDFVEQGLQAKIVCQNENDYVFFQYKEDCAYNITRPINSRLFCDLQSFESEAKRFRASLKNALSKKKRPESERISFDRAVYTLQQAIAATLDALPAKDANRAKKINGDLFERLIRLMMHEAGVPCESEKMDVPICDESGQQIHKVQYQHDLVGRMNGEIRFIGSVKTSSKERIDKIFLDKLLFSRFTKTDIPYIAVFLNDVQRAKSETFGKQKINSTFLSGHFKAYTLRLTSLDGVYYCDLRPQMRTDPFLSSHISSIDKLFFDELKSLCK